ncbi:hypothetical protein [Bradyrhizobium genosp. A]|uniref:hypothetical protein n=1 Tax=Bradyrhizobium genosp. A TaxID=83626 RepID=UPI003CFB8042
MNFGRIVLAFWTWLALGAVAAAGCMDTDNKFWINAPGQQATYDKLMQLMSCPADVDDDEGRQIDAVACNWFVAKGLKELYDVADFTPDTQGKWLSANEIAAWVRSHPDQWTKLGQANEQSTLNDAANGASNQQPILAVMEGDPHGHVALVLQGTLQASSTWKDSAGTRLKVPNSAAFSLNNVSKAYVFCRLSAAFSDPSKVELYFRVK